jgi:2-polyprenyl-3-methyl-5-hydroxy-6-metoxy-1,4-benzoquinol methylase
MLCPVCSSGDLESLFPAHRGECITSDMQIIPESTIDNRLCEQCGFIFNAGGPRGRTEEFYSRTYQLRMHSDNAKNINFSAQGAKSMARAVVEFLVDTVKPDPQGTLLEAGAGKGEFLAEYLALRPQWSTVAFEPSSAAIRLRERLPTTKVYQQNFQTMSIGETFDIVASLAVIEHVEQPVQFLGWLRERMAPDGRLLVTFPDFARNPNDVFCVDHLSKLTASHLKMMADATGLEIEAARHVGIALLAVLRRVDRAPIQTSVLSESRDLFRENETIANGMVAAVQAARNAARARGEKFAVFGLGMSGLVGPILNGFDRSEIAAYVDENETMQGARIGGVPVVGIQEVNPLGLKHIAISASPVYREQILQKLSGLDTTVYV